MSLKLILVMSLSGSFILLCDFILNKWIKKQFSIRWRYQLLKLSMLFFIVPFPLLQGFWLNVLPFGTYYDGISESIIVDYSNSIFIKESGEVILPAYNYSKLFFCIWLAGFLVILIFQFIHYIKYIKGLQKNAVKIEDEGIIQLFDNMKDICHISRRLCLVKSESVHSPLTFGVFSPVIVLPDKKYKVEELQIILRHEMIHIKKYDLVFRFLSLLAISIHWFNPLTYWLFKRLCFVSESDCDEQIVTNQNREYRIFYGNMIIDSATDMNRRQMLTASFGLAGNHKELLKERLELLMSMNKMKKNVRMLSAVTMAAIFMGGTITTFAYDEPMIITGIEYVSSSEDAVVTFGKKEVSASSESYITDDDGNIYHLTDNENAKDICIHEYKSGTYQTHKKNSDGSCVIKYYDAEVCVKCSKSIIGEYTGSYTSARCTH